MMADVFQKSPFGRGFFDGLFLFYLSHFDFPARGIVSWDAYSARR